MTDNTLVSTTPATAVYKNPIAVRFFENLEPAKEEFQQNGKLTCPIIETILGKPPVVPSSPDMDARLEAFEELSKYSDKALDIESKLLSYAKKRA